MTDCYTVRTAETVWEAQGLLDSLTGTSLTPAGVSDASRTGKQLVPHEPTVVYAGTGDAEQETARLLAKELDVKVRTDERLREMDLGLWQGLAIEEIRRRQPRVCKQWLESPSGVRPPSGESLAEAQQRISDALGDILHREHKRRPVIVLGPIVYGLVSCHLAGGSIDEIWQYKPDPNQWERREINELDFRNEDE